MRIGAAALAFLGILLGMPGHASARSKQLQLADRYCEQVRFNMRTVEPIVFTGPDPWSRVDQIPDVLTDQAIALLYAQGPSIRWVFLRIVEESDGWTEDVNYYFAADGSVVKRTRELRVPRSNIELDVTSYYKRGAVTKEFSKHHAIARGKQDMSDFSDPDAPTILDSNDLPFGPVADLWRRLA